MKTSTVLTSIVTATVIAVAGITAVAITNDQAPASSPSDTSQPTKSESGNHEVDHSTEALPETSSSEDLLLYLIEEEKLAHDVYFVLGEAWGGNTFANILASETSHQDQVLNLLDKNGLADPRSTEIGVFANPELQNLFDQLIAQGMTSQTEAYKVGVLIEQKDITDLTTALSSTTDEIVISTLENLLSASESHLAAFNRKL